MIIPSGSPKGFRRTTDFSEYTTGVIMSDWTNVYRGNAPDYAKVFADTGLGGKAFEILEAAGVFTDWWGWCEIGFLPYFHWE